MLWSCYCLRLKARAKRQHQGKIQHNQVCFRKPPKKPSGNYFPVFCLRKLGLPNGQPRPFAQRLVVMHLTSASICHWRLTTSGDPCALNLTRRHGGLRQKEIPCPHNPGRLIHAFLPHEMSQFSPFIECTT